MIEKEPVVHRLNDSSDRAGLIAQVSEPADLGDVNLVFSDNESNNQESVYMQESKEPVPSIKV